MTDRTRAFLGLHLAVLLAGGTGILGRLITLNGLTLVWYRMLVAAAVMALTMALLRRHTWKGLRNTLRIATCGMILTLHWVAFFASIKQSNVSVGVACIATACFFTSLFDPLINRRKFSLLDLLFSFIAIIGIMAIFSLDIRYRTGIALGLLSAALYSLFSVVNVRTAKQTDTDSATMLLWELVGGVILLTILTPLYGATAGDGIALPTKGDIIPLIVLGSLLTVLPIFLQLHALRFLSAFTVNITYNLEPVYSIILAALIFGEAREVGPSFWFGLSLVVISVTLQTIRASRKQATRP